MTAEIEDVRSEVARRCSLICLIVALALSVVASVKIIGRSPERAKTYYDLMMRRTTACRIALSPWYQWIIPALVLAGIAKEVAVRSLRVRLGLSVAHLCLVILVSEFYSYAADQPWFELMREIGVP